MSILKQSCYASVLGMMLHPVAAMPLWDKPDSWQTHSVTHRVVKFNTTSKGHQRYFGRESFINQGSAYLKRMLLRRI